nr:LysR family transcriptional regulator [uncultured Cohaesibacter sp.]
MARDNLNDLQAFLEVAQSRSFTRAAAKMGVSQSALSHTMRNLEERLGVRLLTRTTRAVSPTEAGEMLIKGIAPHLDEISAQLDGVSSLKDKPVGNIRISASDHAIHSVLWPKLQKILPSYPDIKVELIRENRLIDIVAERFDAGVRMGEQLAKDMISARIGPDMRFAVVGSKSYFEANKQPAHPEDLIQHNCINERLQTLGGNWAWEFEEDGREIKIRVEGQLTFSNCYDVLEAALAGFGLAYVPEDIAAAHIAEGRLIRVLEDFCALWEGYYLYYPNRRQSLPAFAVVVDALRHRS